MLVHCGSGSPPPFSELFEPKEHDCVPPWERPQLCPWIGWVEFPLASAACPTWEFAVASQPICPQAALRTETVASPVNAAPLGPQRSLVTTSTSIALPMSPPFSESQELVVVTQRAHWWSCRCAESVALLFYAKPEWCERVSIPRRWKHHHWNSPWRWRHQLNLWMTRLGSAPDTSTVLTTDCNCVVSNVSCTIRMSCTLSTGWIRPTCCCLAPRTTTSPPKCQGICPWHGRQLWNFRVDIDLLPKWLKRRSQANQNWAKQIVCSSACTHRAHVRVTCSLPSSGAHTLQTCKPLD